MAAHVVVNNRTAVAVKQIRGLTSRQLKNFADRSVELMKSPATPKPRRETGTRRIIHDNPGDKWQYTGGGVGRMFSELAKGIRVDKDGKDWKISTTTGYGAYHILGTAHTNPNPADARAFETASKELEGSGPWA